MCRNRSPQITITIACGLTRHDAGSSHCSVEVTGLDVRLEPAEAADTGGGTHPIDLQSSFREGEADGAAWGSDGVAHPETSQEELTRQQDTDTQLKRLLLETELTLKQMRVTLQAPPPQDGTVHLPALSLAFDELTVCNAAGADGDESAGVDGVHEFRKRLGVLGLRLELSVVDRSGVLGAPAALVCRDGTWDSVDVAVRRNTDAQGGSTTVDLRADVGGIRAAIAPVHCDALATLHSQFLKTAAGWAPAPIAAMRGLAASALSVSGSLMSGSFGDHDDQQLNTAATDLSLSLHESLVDIAGTIRESVWVRIFGRYPMCIAGSIACSLSSVSSSQHSSLLTQALHRCGMPKFGAGGRA
eukprot:COSAG01_NODE_428_length_17193_cov_45.999123_3_plen_358_part_00